nr:PREDICTED: ectopic P granules protein 5 homolog [Bemisia tabaci]
MMAQKERRKKTKKESEVECLITDAMGCDGDHDKPNETIVHIENETSVQDASKKMVNDKFMYVNMCDNIITDSIEAVHSKIPQPPTLEKSTEDPGSFSATIFDIIEDVDGINHKNVTVVDTPIAPSAENGNEFVPMDSSVDTLLDPLNQLEIGFTSPSAPSMVPDIECTNHIPSQPKSLSLDSRTSPVDSVAELSSLLHKKDEMEPFTPAQLASLYRNKELEQNEAIISEFVDAELRSGHIVRHPLYDLLVNYLRIRAKIDKNKLELEFLKQNCAEYQKNIWSLELARISENGECQDGNPVVGTYEYRVSRMNEVLYSKLSHSLLEIQEIRQELSFNIHSCEVIKFKVENFIQSLVSHFNFLNPNTPVSLVPESSAVSHQVSHIKIELRSAISVLFAFQRQPISDEGFVSFVRNYLNQLIAILVRVATWKDHLFILNHILRCPAGFSSWAANFIQLPVPYEGSHHDQAYLDHFIAVLAGVLLPINSREQFLQSFLSDSESEGEALWVFVNEDGDDEADEVTGKKIVSALKEDDVTDLLNQIPFEQFFRQLLLITNRDGNDFYDPSIISDRDILRMLAISSLVVGLLECGMTNFSAPRYKQFVKRLGRLAVHIVEYASDHLKTFRSVCSTRSIVDSSLFYRLQIEYDGFFKRSFLCLYNNQATWQFLTSLPYDLLSIHNLFKLFPFLVPFSNNLPDVEAFEETLLSLSDEKIIYLLTTISNMASARSVEDWVFIKSIALLLLKVGVMSSKCRDKCSKSVRNLLASLTTRFPNLLSEFIYIFKNEFSDAGKITLFLFNTMCLDNWRPTEQDFNIISNWLLLYPLISAENNLGRFIIDRLNYGFDASNENLFLPYDVHCKVAILVVKTAVLHGPETVGSQKTDVLSESMKQVSSIVKLQSPEQILSAWAWRVLLKLRLHLLDQSSAKVFKTVINVCQAVSNLPSLEHPTEEMKCLSENIGKHQSIALYASLMMTTSGHSLPLICNQGFDFILKLINSYYYTPAFVSLELIFPLFIESAQSLYSSQKFRNIMLSLLAADRTYSRSAKNLIYTDFPGPILAQFGDLINFHLKNFESYALNNFGPIIELWLNCLLSVWKMEPASTVYLINILLKTAFFDANMRLRVLEILTTFYKSQMMGDSHNSTNGLSFLVSWMSNSTQAYPTLIPKNIFQPELSWYALFVLEIEEKIMEIETNVWSELLQSLASSNKKTSIDNSLKRVCSNLKIPCFGSAMLAIFRWSQFGLALPCDDPVLPLFWQKFFMLYLARVPGPSDKGSVGYKFFEGISNQMYLKKIKKKLLDSVEHHNNELKKITSNNSPLEEFHENLVRFYNTLLLWLEEARLQEADLFLPAFPSNYNTYKLSLILEKDASYWTEYLNVMVIEDEKKASVKNWMDSKNRGKENLFSSTANSCLMEDDPIKRIIKRLKSYDTPKAPPQLKPSSQVIPSYPRDALLNKTVMMEKVQKSLKPLANFSASHAAQLELYSDLDSKFLNSLLELYKDVEKEIVLKAACDTVSPNRRKSPQNLHCAGPATIRLLVREAQINYAVDAMLKENRSESERLLKASLLEPPSNLCISTIFIENLVKAFEQEFLEVSKIGDAKLICALKDVGVALFYHFVSVFEVETFVYAPSKQFILDIIHLLGERFIDNEEAECSRLLDTVLKKPKLEQILTTHFTPLAAPSPVFLLMYRTLCDSIDFQSVDLCFSLLSKFDVQQWLVSKKPRLSERSQLLDLIRKSLSYFGSRPANAVASIHEVYRKHLCVLLAHEFPEHYGEILHSVLSHTAEESISPEVWFSVLNTLIGSSQYVLKPDLSISQLKDIARKYATEQRSLSYHELTETIVLLSNHFMKERVANGLYGLYPKYKIYLESFNILLMLISHALIASILQQDRGSLGDKLCEQLWPKLLNLFSPWISPYFTSQLNEPTPSWVQQLADDRSVLPPFVAEDTSKASKVMTIFVEAIKFIFEVFPNNSNILSFVLQFYGTSYANAAIKEFILKIVHDNLITLPWQKYVPYVQDLDLMIKIVDQYLPNCHTFLGAIFIEVQWPSIVSLPHPVPVRTKIHSILLHLLIKLGNEPNVRQSGGRITVLLLEAQKFHWYLVDSNCYQSVCNWFVMSYDPRVILSIGNNDSIAVDIAALELLQVSAGYVDKAQYYHATTSVKRQLYVRSVVKMILQLITRHKSIAQSRLPDLKQAISRILDKMELVIVASVPPENQTNEVGLLLVEFVTLLNQPRGTTLSNLSTEVLLSWLQNKSFNCVVLRGLLHIAGSSIEFDETLGSVLECCCNTWFSINKNGVAHQQWDHILQVIQPIQPRAIPIENFLLANNHLLILFALTLKSIPSPQNLSEELSVLNKVVLYISSVKPCKTSEIKLVLFWALALRLCANQVGAKDCSTETSARIIEYLHKIVANTSLFAEQKSNWGFLGAIGLVKQNSNIIRFRLLAKAVSTYILAQIPNKFEASSFFIRCSKDAPGAVSDTSGELTPSVEALKSLNSLECLLSEKSFVELKNIIELCISMIKGPENSLENGDNFVLSIARLLFPEGYLHATLPTLTESGN